MVHYVNNDALCWELSELIKNNHLDGSLQKRFSEAEKSVLNKVKEIIKDNKKDIINEFEKVKA